MGFSALMSHTVITNGVSRAYNRLTVGGESSGCLFHAVHKFHFTGAMEGFSFAVHIGRICDHKGHALREEWKDHIRYHFHRTKICHNHFTSTRRSRFLKSCILVRFRFVSVALGALVPDFIALVANNNLISLSNMVPLLS